jgi:hypothetical protein
MNLIKINSLIEMIHSLDGGYVPAQKSKSDLLNKLKSLLFDKDYKGKKQEKQIREWIEAKNDPNRDKRKKIPKPEPKHDGSVVALENERVWKNREKNKSIIYARQDADLLREMIEDGKRMDRVATGFDPQGPDTDEIINQIYGKIINKENRRKINERIEKNGNNQFRPVPEGRRKIMNNKNKVLLLRPPNDEAEFKKVIDQLPYRSGNSEKISERKATDINEFNSRYKHSNVQYYFHNQISSVKDITDFVDYVKRAEERKKRRRFKTHVDFGCIKETLNPPDDGGDDGDGDESYSYQHFVPMELNLQREIPMIIHSNKTANIYKDYLRSELIRYQNFTL